MSARSGQEAGATCGLNAYEALTHGIRVSVTPEFVGADPDAAPARFVWAYHVTIENLSDITVQLTARAWHIVDGLGRTQSVNGPGVVGEQPILKQGDSFTYSSSCPLPTPSGLMSGHYLMRTESGTQIQVQIPPFSLDSPYDTPIIN
ncbi:MAG: hypothetical protein RL186_771 [Pseudomonadota bacterium]